MTTLSDLYSYFGSDLGVSATGDLLPVVDTERGQQRILRRLLTNPTVTSDDGSVIPGDYIWHPEYGAGLPRYIGQLKDVPKVKALIRGQMLLEDSVAQTPEPQIDLQDIPNGLSCTIRYVDAQTKTPQTLSFSVTA